jgi:hypothetical protein
MVGGGTWWKTVVNGANFCYMMGMVVYGGEWWKMVVNGEK